MITHHHLALRLKKEYSYTSNPPLGLHSLLQGELYLYLYFTLLINVLPILVNPSSHTL